MNSIEECAEMINIQIERTNQFFADRFVILLNGKAIGIAGCASMDNENTTFGLYYQLGQQYWGSGYARPKVNGRVWQFYYQQHRIWSIRVRRENTNETNPRN